MVECVEELTAELQVYSLPDLNIFEERQVHHVRPWPSHRRAPRRAEAIRRRDKTTSFEEGDIAAHRVARPLAPRESRVADLVGPHRAVCAYAERVSGAPDGDGEARLECHDPVGLPAADQMVYHPAGAAAEAFALPEWKLIDKRGGEAEPVVIRRQPLVSLLVVNVLDAVAGVVVAAAEGLRVADGLRPGEGVDECQPAGKSLLEAPKERMIGREGGAGGLEPVVESDQLPVEDGEREQAPQVGVNRRRNDRVWRPRLARIEILAAVEPGTFAAGIRYLGDYVSAQLLLDAEIPVLDVGVPEVDAEGVGPRRERPDWRIVEQVSDKGLRSRQSELERRERLLIFPHERQVLDRVLEVAGRDRVEEQPITGPDDRIGPQTVGDANARAEIVFINLDQRARNFFARHHDLRQLVDIQIVECQSKP